MGRGDTDAAASPRLSYAVSYESLTLTRQSIVREKKEMGQGFQLVRSPDMHCDTLQPSELQLSPPADLPPILHLPIGPFRSRSLPPTHPLSRSGPSA